MKDLLFACDVTIIGGGLAGLVNSILLSRKGLKVILIEKKSYPFHRVCGEYISNEVKPFLVREGLFPHEMEPSDITDFQLTSVNGKSANMPLDLGAFGISRYQLDLFLFQKTVEAGTQALLNQTAVDVSFDGSQFTTELKSGEKIQSPIAIGAFGKRSVLDKKMDRPFMEKRSPYVGVKYHIRTDFPDHIIALHNFPDGYCGLSKIEDDLYNLCYLSHRNNLKQFGNVSEMESQILFQNPYLKKVFKHSEFVFEKPEVINEISFEPKESVENHVLMSGDAAGMITPLCGNGMAMAIHSAKILSDTILKNWNSGELNRTGMEEEYTKAWNRYFKTRLWAGRNIQKLFGAPIVSNLAVATTRHIRPLANFLMKQTHGVSF